MEGTGKTTTCRALLQSLRAKGLEAAALVDHYNEPGASGTLIAAITEDPEVRLEGDLTLFFLYCARLSDKAHLALRLLSAFDIVVVDRLDLTLLARATAAWNIDELLASIAIARALDPLTGSPPLLVCLDAPTELCLARCSSKPVRRRSSMPRDAWDRVRARTLWEARRRGVEVIDTAATDLNAVVARINALLT